MSNHYGPTSITAIGVLDAIGSRLVTWEGDHWIPRPGCSSVLHRLTRDILEELIEDPSAEWWKVKGVSADMAIEYACSQLEVLHDAFPKCISFPLKSQLTVMLNSRHWPRKAFVKYAKYTTAAPMAKYLGNELPPNPCKDGGLTMLPWSGPVRNYLRTQLVTRSRRSLAYWNSVLQGVKRACAPPDESFIADAYEDHRAALTVVPAQYEEDLVEYVHRLIPGRLPKCNRVVLSNSASFATVRSQGGGAEEVVRKHNGVSFDEPMVEVLLRGVETSPGVVKWIHGREVPSRDELRQLTLSSPHRHCVKAVGLLEPLKVRVITCGDACMQSYLETIRRPIHDYLRQLAPLKLIGKPLDQEDLRSLLARERALGLDFPHWVSGDYKAATDNLNAIATRQVARALLDAAGRPEDVGLVEQSLFGTTLQYPAKGPSGTHDQLNGQLMGNPMSFPILTITNLIAYWRTLEDYLGREVEVDELPVLVNGDDILFRGDDEFIKSWKEVIARLGLTLSVGKCYVHPRVMTLNSECYVMKRGSGKDVNEVDFDRIEYFNPGLIRKGYAVKAKAQLLSVSSAFTQLLRGAQTPDRAKRRMLASWKEQVATCTRNGRFNLFLPVTIGGIGADPNGAEFTTTAAQRRLSYCMQLHQVLNPHDLQSRTCAISRKVPTTSSLMMKSNPEHVTFTYDRNEPLVPKPMSSDPSGARRQDMDYDPWDSWQFGRYRVPTGSWIRRLERTYLGPTRVQHAVPGIDPTGKWVRKESNRKYFRSSLGSIKEALIGEGFESEDSSTGSVIKCDAK